MHVCVSVCVCVRAECGRDCVFCARVLLLLYLDVADHWDGAIHVDWSGACSSELEEAMRQASWVLFPVNKDSDHWSSLLWAKRAGCFHYFDTLMNLNLQFALQLAEQLVPILRDPAFHGADQVFEFFGQPIGEQVCALCVADIAHDQAHVSM